MDLIIEESAIVFTDHPRETLGKGGFGVVRRGVYENKAVAVKCLLLKEEHAKDSLLRANLLLTEAMKMRELEHPRIVKMYGFVLETCSLVMEYMPGGGLDEYIHRHPFIRWTDRWMIMSDVAEGMAYLHAKTKSDGTEKFEAFHQDLKSANILLRKESGQVRAKISDFGFSVLREGNGGLKRSTSSLRNIQQLQNEAAVRPETNQTSRMMGALTGFDATKPTINHGVSVARSFISTRSDSKDKLSTPDASSGQEKPFFLRPSIAQSYVEHIGGTEAYMAPELLTTNKFTKHCDVYAFGVILLELSFLKQAFVAVLEYRFSPSDVIIPPLFHKLIDDCLSKVPTLRPSFDAIKDILCNTKALEAIEEFERQVVLPTVTEMSTSSWDSFQDDLESRIQEASKEKLGSKFPDSLSIRKTKGKLKAASKTNLSAPTKNPKRCNKKILLALLIAVVVGLAAGLGAGFGLKGRTLVTQVRPWRGVNAPDILAFNATVQDTIIQQWVEAGVSVVRVTLRKRTVWNMTVEDVQTASTEYNDDILNRMNSLLYKLHGVKIRVLLVLHDRLALNCFSDDVYATYLKLNQSTECVHQTNVFGNPDGFYRSTVLANMFMQRIQRILSFTHPQFNNRPWSELEQVFYGFEIQNQPQTWMNVSYVSNDNWQCKLAFELKKVIAPGIWIVDGGPQEFAPLSFPEQFLCPHIDAVTLFGYSNHSGFVQDLLRNATQFASQYNNKKVYMRFDCRAITMPNSLELMMQWANSYSVPWLLSDVTVPELSSSNRTQVDKFQVPQCPSLSIEHPLWPLFKQKSTSV